MKINKTIMMACIASFCTLSLVTGCSSDTIDETPGDSNNSNDETTYLDGYAHPDGVIILNQGARVSQNSTITYIIGFTKTSDGIFMILQVACSGNCFPDSCHNGYRVLFFL